VSLAVALHLAVIQKSEDWLVDGTTSTRGPRISFEEGLLTTKGGLGNDNFDYACDRALACQQEHGATVSMSQ